MSRDRSFRTPWELAPCGRIGRFAYDPAVRAARLLAADTAAVLDQCNRYRTLEEHAEAVLSQGLQQSGDEEPSGAIARVLEGFVRDGLLVSAEDVISGDPSDERGRPIPIGVLGVLTKGRPDTLARAAASYIKNLAEHERRARILVLEDSPSSRDRNDSAEAIAAVGGKPAECVRLIDREDRRRLLARLRKTSGVDEPLLGFAIFGLSELPYCVGAVRNTLLLEAAGESLVSVDDDTVCESAAAPDSDEVLALSDSRDPSELWFPSIEEDLDIKPAPADFIGPYESVLGRPVPDIAADYDWSGVDVAELKGRLETSLRQRRAKVTVASCGIWGDAGSGANGFFALGGRSRARLLRSEREYIEAVTSRQVFRAATRKTIASGGFCMGASLGLDNRELLPPFFPALRGSDSIFGEVLSQRLPHSFFAAIPRALAHRPPVTRRQTFDDIWKALSGVQMANLVEIAVRSSPETTDEDSSLSLRALGRYLEDLGSLSLPSFREFFIIHCIRSGSWQAQQLQQRIDDLARTPRWFAGYLKRYIEVIAKSQTQPEYIVPVDLSRAVGAERALPLARDLIRRYGLLLQAWPQVVDAALLTRDA